MAAAAAAFFPLCTMVNFRTFRVLKNLRRLLTRTENVVYVYLMVIKHIGPVANKKRNVRRRRSYNARKLRYNCIVCVVVLRWSFTRFQLVQLSAVYYIDVRVEILDTLLAALLRI